MRYGSVEQMLERYMRLTETLHAPRSLLLPDPRTSAIAHSRPTHIAHTESHQLVEMVDIGRLLHLARLNEQEQLVLAALFRPRKRHCKRCRRSYPHDAPRCRRCKAATEDECWSHEPLPTLAVLADELTQQTGARWSVGQTRRLRDRMYGKLQRLMYSRFSGN